jgi:GAF domain-containing protein/ligand-binding sensor domain-containing protein
MGIWRRYEHDPEVPGSLSHNLVRAFVEDGSGDLWVGTADGLNRLDGDQERFARYRTDPDNPESLSSSAVQCLHRDRSGNLWVGTASSGLNRYVPQLDSFVHYRHDPKNPDTPSSDHIMSVIEDSSGALWIGTDRGLDRFSPATGEWRHYQNEPIDPHSVSANEVRALYEDRSGGIWIGTYGAGLNRYEKQREQFTHYSATPNEENSLSVRSVWSIIEDQSGVLWIGTDGGGLDRFDRQTGEWKHYANDPDDPASLGSNVVMSVYKDRQGVLWLGTAGAGLARFDAEAEKFNHYRSDPGDGQSLSNNVVWTTLEDSDGTLWIGTAYGLNRFDRETETFTRFLHDPDDPSTLSDNNVGRIYEDREGTLWLGTHGGLNQFDRDSERFTHYVNDPDDPQSLSHDIVFSTHQDASGTLWLGTWGGGLNRFDGVTETFTHYRVKDGLPNDVVYGILEDGEGNLWMSTNSGISRYDPRTEIFRNYDAQDGLQSAEFNYNAHHKSPSGEMFFGGINGFNAFYPERVRDNPYVPSIALTSLTRGGDAVDVVRAGAAPAEVTLEWPKNDLEFEFAALSFFRPEDNQYAYRLEEFDDGWNQVGTRRFGQYTGLPGGSYTLRIRGSNNDGVWNEEGASLRISVVPPIWETWWFRGVAGLLLAAAAVGAYRLRVRSIGARSRELEEQVASRTQELAALNSIADVVSCSLDAKQILQDALAMTLEVTGFEAGGIYLLGPQDEQRDGQVLTIAESLGLDAELVGEIDNLVVGEGFSGHVVQTGEPLVVRDIPSDPRLTRSMVTEQGYQSVAIAPLVSRAEVLGTLFVMTRSDAQVSQEDVNLLTAIGGQIGVAVENARLFGAEQRRAEQFRLINRAGHQITSILEVDQLLGEIVQAIMDAFDYYAVGVGLIEGDKISVREAAGVYRQEGTAPPLSVKVGDQGVVAHVAATGESLLVRDVGKEPRYLAWPEGTETRSELAVPLKAKGRVIGVLNVESDRLDAFDASDVMLLQSLASQAAVAIENARLFEAEQRRAEQFRVIAEAGRGITLTLDTDEALAQLTELVHRTFGYYHVAVGLVEGGEVVFRYGSGELWDDPEFSFSPARLKVGEEGLTGWVAATGKPLLVADVSREPRYVWMRESKTRSELVVPIMVKDEVIGVLDAQSDRLDAFDETDLAVLEALSHQAGAAIENARLYEQARQAAVVQERSRLARDLHDAVTQTLFSASLLAEAIPACWEIDPNEGRSLLEELRRLTRGALAEMRTLLLELRPAVLDETRLVDLVNQLAEAATGRMGVPVAVDIEGECALPADVHEALYRIAQEALNNVVKHSRASHVEVTFRCYEPDGGGRGASVHLSIVDNGRGFDRSHVAADRLGLGIMRERAESVGAPLEIETQAGEGTRVSVVWRATEGDSGAARSLLPGNAPQHGV